MRAEKQSLSAEYINRLNSSPFFIIADYQGLSVGHFVELRKRLRPAGAEIHVIKNSIFRVAAKAAGLGDFGADLRGQLAVVTGKKDISAAAKTLKTFQTEFERPKIRSGYLDNAPLKAADIIALADLPSIEVLRAKLLGVIQAPATKLVQLLNTPGGQLARVIKAKAEKA